MFKKNPGYLALQSCGYCFRMTVPKDLKAVIGKNELRYSLKEGSLRTAKSKAKMIAGQASGLFNNLRKDSSNMTTLTRVEINELILACWSHKSRPDYRTIWEKIQAKDAF